MKKKVAQKKTRTSKPSVEQTAVDSLYKLRNEQLEKENAELKQALSKSLFTKEYIDINIGDPLPTDPTKRREYVSAVAGIHTLILRKKLLSMISTSRAILEKQENDPIYDQAVKGAIFGLWEIIRWGDLMVSEDISLSSGDNPSKPEDKNKNNNNEPEN